MRTRTTNIRASASSTGIMRNGPPVAVSLFQPPDSLQSGGFYVSKCKTMKAVLHYCIYIYAISKCKIL